MDTTNFKIDLIHITPAEAYEKVKEHMLFMDNEEDFMSHVLDPEETRTIEMFHDLRMFLFITENHEHSRQQTNPKLIFMLDYFLTNMVETINLMMLKEGLRQALIDSDEPTPLWVKLAKIDYALNVEYRMNPMN